MSLEIPKLTYFLAAAQTLNFRKAAELCAIAQPVLSRQIATLESELGVELFQRVKKRVVLTPAGSEFIGYARQSLEALQKGQQAMTELQIGERGLVRIGCIEGFGTEILPQLFARFRQRFPLIRLQITIRGTDELLQMVENQQLDFAVVGMTFDRGKPPETLLVQTIFHDYLHLLVHPTHLFAQQNGDNAPLLLEQIVTEPIVLLREGFIARRVLEGVFARKGWVIQPVAEVDMLEGVLALVRANVGVTFIPPLMIGKNQTGELLALPIADLQEEFVFGVVQSRFSVLSKPANALIRTILEELKKEN